MDNDSNVVFTKTPIILWERKGNKWEEVTVTQKKFDNMVVDGTRYRYVNDTFEDSVYHFRQKGDFMKQLLDAIDNQSFGPSWKQFIYATKNAYPISIITARGQPMSELREGHRYIIEKTLDSKEVQKLTERMKENLQTTLTSKDLLIEKYLDNNCYFPVSSDEFLKEFHTSHAVPMKIRKNMGFEKFVGHVNEVFTTYYGDKFREYKKFSVGFSDDLTKNIEQMESFIRENLLEKWLQTKFVLYNTHNPKYIKKIILQGGDQPKSFEKSR